MADHHDIQLSAERLQLDVEAGQLYAELISSLLAVWITVAVEPLSADAHP